MHNERFPCREQPNKEVNTGIRARGGGVFVLAHANGDEVRGVIAAAIKSAFGGGGHFFLDSEGRIEGEDERS